MCPVFKYQAKNKQGNSVNGSISSDNKSQVVNQLRDQGYFVVNIKEVKEKGFSLNVDLGSLRKKKVTTSDLAIFSRQFHVMVNAGIPLIESLVIIKEQTDHPTIEKVVTEMIDEIEKGESLSGAMEKFPEVFPRLFTQLIKAGEVGGVLDTVLQRLADHYKRQSEINNQIRSAMYYPLTILVVAIVSIFFLMTFVVPNLISIFADLNSTLPLPTRILIFFSDLFQNFWWLIIAVVVFGILGFFSYVRTKTGREHFDRFILKVPVFGPMRRKIEISRFSHTLGVLLSSGVTLLDALAIVDDVVGNKVISDVLIDARTRLREGIALSEPLKKSEEFPPMVIQMISVGEETGQLDEMLDRLADFYDSEVQAAIDGSISLIEPVMIVMLAVIVGFIAISIVMPMFDMYTAF